MKYSIQYSEARHGDDVQTTYSYFCRICSERLAEFVEEDRTAEILGAVGSLDDYTRKIIWVEAVNAAENVRFPMPVDPRQFAGTAVDVCHPLLLQAEGALLKRGRRAATRPRGAPAPTADDPFGDEETVDPRTHLYIALFVYAYVLNLIRTSHESAAGASRRLGFENVRPGAAMSAYAQAILTAVLKKYAGVISQIEDITPDFIAERFREAYRLVVGAEGGQELVAADEAGIIVNEIVTLGPTYHYIAIAARVFGVLPVARPTEPATARREFETVLGRTLPAILEDRATDSKSELVQKLLGVRPTNRGSRRVAVEYPRGSDPLYVYSAPEVNFLRDMMRVPPARASTDMAPLDTLIALANAIPACKFHCVVEAVGGRASPPAKAVKGAKSAQGANNAKGAKSAESAKGAKNAKGAKGAKGVKSAGPSGVGFREDLLWAAGSGLYLDSYRLFYEYTVDAVDAASMEAYQRQLELARKRERGYLLYRAATAVKNYRRYDLTVQRRFGRYGDYRPEARRRNRLPGSDPEVPITYLYDEDGLEHSWATRSAAKNIYVYSDGGGAVVELTRAEITAAVAAAYAAGENAGPIYGRTLQDVRCSVCKTLLSEIHRLDAKKAAVSLHAIAEYNSFFTFFASRCPKGDLHDFQGEAGARTCAKCEMSEILIFSHGVPRHAAAARAYYDKYSGEYGNLRSYAATLHSAVPRAAVDDPAARALEKFGSFARAWKHDYTMLVRAAEVAEVPIAALETLGATEGREYPEVLDGTGAPPPPTSPEDPRLLAVDSDVRVFVSEYNRLRFFHRFPKPSASAAALLAAADVPRAEYESLAQRLPDVFDDYGAKRLALQQLRSPEDVLMFSIESLARMAVGVAASAAPPDWLPRLGKSFAREALRDIVRSERLLAKHGSFNFKIFGDEDIGGGSLGGIDAPAEDFGDGGEDALDAAEAAGGEDGAVDPFSLEAVDIDDDDPNLEPD